VTPTRGAHLPERERRGEGVTGWADCWAGKGRERRFFLFFTLIIYLFSEIE